MYLTRVIISKQEEGRFRLLTPNDYHKRVWEMLRGTDERDFIWRLNEKDTYVELLILSERVPQSISFGEYLTKTIPDELFKYRRYRFSLKANPTKRVLPASAGICRYKRAGIYSDDDLIQWLESKSEQSGFSVESVEILSKRKIVFNKRRSSNVSGNISQNRCAFSSVEFSGVLTVNDVTRFKNAYFNGIGTGKGFGFGMLMIYPIGDE